MFYLPDLSFARRVSSICLIRLAFFALALCPAQRAGANVYATNIRIQGSVSNAATGTTVFLPCGTVGITYLLNEPANAGVVVEIFSGGNVLWTKAFAGGSPGTLRGMNP